MRILLVISDEHSENSTKMGKNSLSKLTLDMLFLMFTIASYRSLFTNNIRVLVYASNIMTQ